MRTNSKLINDFRCRLLARRGALGSGATDILHKPFGLVIDPRTTVREGLQ